MAGKVRVFLSYRRADTQHVAGRVADKFGDAVELFMDIDTIPPGVDFTDFVRRAVTSCDVLVAFIGSRWLDLTDDTGRRRLDDPNDWVVEEIRVALGRGVRVIPVLVDGARMPRAEELPESLRPLVNRQALTLDYSSFSTDAARLLAAVEHAAATSAPVDQFADRWDTPVPHQPPPVPPVRVPQRRRRRAIMVAAGLIVVAAAAGAVITLTRPDGRDPTTGGTAEQTTSGSATASAPNPTLTPARSVEQLRGRIPAEFRRTCQAFQPGATDLQPGLQVAVQCVPARGDLRGRNPKYSFYFQYVDAGAATAAFRSYYGSGGLPEGDCTQTAAESRLAHGVLRCYQDAEGLYVFAWTHDELAIVASAVDPSMAYPELNRWYRQAGPLG